MRAMLALAAFVIGAACGPGFAQQQGARNWDSERSRMVSDQLRARDITDTRVLDAMLKVPRHLFVPEPQRTQRYGDHPLSIGHNQTISQPYIVAFMTQGLKVERESSRARDRNRIRLPGRDPRPPRQGGLHHRDHRAPRERAPARHWRGRVTRMSTCATATAIWVGRSTRRTTESWSRQRPTKCRRRSSRS